MKNKTQRTPLNLRRPFFVEKWLLMLHFATFQIIALLCLLILFDILRTTCFYK